MIGRRGLFALPLAISCVHGRSSTTRPTRIRTRQSETYLRRSTRRRPYLRSDAGYADRGITELGIVRYYRKSQRADAALKGSSDEAVFTEEHHITGSIGVHASDGRGSSSGASLGTSSLSRSNAGVGISESETSHIQERRHESTASVRLVSPEGDVLWSTTQESNGAKFRGAMADVADKVARRLIEETKRAVALPSPPHAVSDPATKRRVGLCPVGAVLSRCCAQSVLCSVGAVLS